MQNECNPLLNLQTTFLAETLRRLPDCDCGLRRNIPTFTDEMESADQAGEFHPYPGEHSALGHQGSVPRYPEGRSHFSRQLALRLGGWLDHLRTAPAMAPATAPEHTPMMIANLDMTA
jgi:hypothetical protein